MSNTSNSINMRGVEGWLALLVAGLIALGPLAGFSRLMQDFSETERQYPTLLSSVPWQNYKQWSWYVFGITAAISIAAGYRLWKIHFTDSVRFAILALWLAGPVSNLGQIAVTWFAVDTEATLASLPELAGTLITSVIAAGIWTAYLRMSVRVRNTYIEPVQVPAA